MTSSFSRIITVDSNLSLLPGSRHHTWVVDQLAQLPDETKFVFVSLHHPPVADGIENNHSHDVRPNEHALALLLKKQAEGPSPNSLLWQAIYTITSDSLKAG